mmetsp:Transcript_13422/g.31548  ORF Transcript_13422/g.31548 Transcript_13422/m.31548 type:complete len:876 (-) Transcript_13422:165-2792(-)
MVVPPAPRGEEMQFRTVSSRAVGGPTPSTSSSSATTPPRSEAGEMIMVYRTWAHLLDMPDENLPIAQLLQKLAEGGEVLRSLVQFLARATDPHRSQAELQCLPEGQLRMIRRSFVAMRIACASFMGLPQSPITDMQVIGSICSQLLDGLLPRSHAHSMHICTVLQHMLHGFEEEVLRVLLRQNAPFVLLRALNRPGCAEFLQALVLGCDVLLPSVMVEVPLRPMSTYCLRDVLRYLERASWATCLVTVLEQGVMQAAEASQRRERVRLQSREVDLSRSSPYPRPHGASPSSPSSPSRVAVRRQSPLCRTPVRRGTFQYSSPKTPNMSLITTPQRLATPKVEASPLLALTVAPSSPVLPQSPPLAALRCPSPPPWTTRSPEPPLACLSPDIRGCAERLCASPLLSGACASPLLDRGCPSPLLERAGLSPLEGTHLNTDLPSVGPDSELDKGVGLLLEFLTGMLDLCARSSEQLHRRGHEGDEDLALRVELRQRFLGPLLVESPLVQHVFKLLICGAAEFEAAHLANAILLQMADPRRCLFRFKAQLLELYLPHVDTLSKIITRGVLDGTTAAGPFANVPGFSTAFAGGRQAAAQSAFPSKNESLRPIGLAVKLQEPIGALRVLAMQMLATLAELAPEETFLRFGRSLWKLLVDWFFIHRCNHIFQATCSRLLCAALRFGGGKEYEAAVLRTRLIPRLCDTVLREGACGETWHDLSSTRSAAEVTTSGGERIEKLQVTVRRKRHPGGLGSIKAVMQALCEVQELALQECTEPAPTSEANTVEVAAATREPLAPRAGPQEQIESVQLLKPKAASTAFEWPTQKEMLHSSLESSHCAAQAAERRRSEARQSVAKALADAPIWAMALTAAGVPPLQRQSV